jgi:spoIIIJ-associated protein
MQLNEISTLAAEFVGGILQNMGYVSKAEGKETEGNSVSVEITGADSAQIIGFRGEVLDAIQYLTLTYLNGLNRDFGKVVIDCENYRGRRRDTLSQLANRLAEKAVRLARKIELEPMNPFERRVIHSALQAGGIARTESVGEEGNRRVIIIPLGVELVSDEPLKNERRDDRNDRRGGRRDDRGRSGDRRDGRRDDRGRGRDNRRDDREGRGRREYDDRPAREREEAPEVPDGKVYTGYYTNPEEPKKADTPKTGAPKYKSFGHKKRF